MRVLDVVLSPLNKAMPHESILIITNGHPSRNPRPVKEASALSAAGYEVTLLYVRNHPPSAPADASVLRDATYRDVAIDLMSETLRGRLYSWYARSASKLARQTIRFGHESPHALGPATQLLNAARRLPAALTIVHNEAPHWAGLQLIQSGRRVAVDMEDWHSEDLLPQARKERPLSLIRATERQLFQSAAYVTTTSYAMGHALASRYGGQTPIVITNSFPLHATLSRTPASDSDPSLFWFSQTIGPGRGLEEFIRGWRQTTRSSRLVLLGQALPGYESLLRSQLPEPFQSRVTFRPLVEPNKLPSVIAEHAVGLALELSEPANKNLTISNKILQYLNAGLAVIASDTAGQREVLERRPEAGTLIKLNDAGSIANAVDRLLNSPSILRQQQRAARALAEETYCWEKQIPTLLTLVEKALH